MSARVVRARRRGPRGSRPPRAWRGCVADDGGPWDTGAAACRAPGHRSPVAPCAAPPRGAVPAALIAPAAPASAASRAGAATCSPAPRWRLASAGGVRRACGPGTGRTGRGIPSGSRWRRPTRRACGWRPRPPRGYGDVTCDDGPDRAPSGGPWSASTGTTSPTTGRGGGAAGGPLVAAAASSGAAGAAAGSWARTPADGPLAGRVRVDGSVRSAARVLAVGSVNDDARPGPRGRRPRAGRAVAVVTPWLGVARPRRGWEVVVRRGVVVAVGRRLAFGPAAAFGSGSAGRGDVLLAATARRRGRWPGCGREQGDGRRYAARTDRRAGCARPWAAVRSMLRGGRDLVRRAPGSATSPARARWSPGTPAGPGSGWSPSTAAAGSSPVSRYGLPTGRSTEAVRGLGATEAVMVDGGGSTTMALRGKDGGSAGWTRPPVRRSARSPTVWCSIPPLSGASGRERAPAGGAVPARVDPQRAEGADAEDRDGQQHRQPPVAAGPVEEQPHDGGETTPAMPKPVFTSPLAAPAWSGATSIGRAQIVEFVSSRKKNAGRQATAVAAASGARTARAAGRPGTRRARRTSGSRRAISGTAAAQQLVGEPAAGEVPGDARRAAPGWCRARSRRARARTRS